jgi:type VI secretion system protein ImpG
VDPRLLKYYNRELQYMREMGAEFAAEFPKIAGRLSLEGIECADPYVERLLEGFSFLAARIQLKIDQEFPRFTQHFLQTVYPHCLSPTPSMAIVQFQPDMREIGLAEGFLIPRGTALRSLLGKGDHTACEYRTAQDVYLWPIEIKEADYFVNVGAYAPAGIGNVAIRAGLRLRLRTSAGLTFDKLALDKISIFLRGKDEVPWRIFEQLVGNLAAIVVASEDEKSVYRETIPATKVRALGFADNEALLPNDHRTFSGYRLLKEYFAFPEKFLGLEVGGIDKAVKRSVTDEIDIIFLLDRHDGDLEDGVSLERFSLFCCPAINLFPKRADRIHLNERSTELHVVPDRTRSSDYEVYDVTGVIGYGSGTDADQVFVPLYGIRELNPEMDGQRYYTLRRVPRRTSSRQRRSGVRSGYVGTEVYLSLVDGRDSPYKSDLRQIAVDVLCTNRDLPNHLVPGAGRTDFTMDIAAPVSAVRCLVGPTSPRSSPVLSDGDAAWRTIGQLSLNYCSLADTDAAGIPVLRKLLELSGDSGNAAIRKQIESLRSVEVRPIVRRVPISGPLAFGRGLEITVTFDESGFQGASAFLLGAVLDAFFSRYVSLNSFSETVIRTVERGEIMRWPMRLGRRQWL